MEREAAVAVGTLDPHLGGSENVMLIHVVLVDFFYRPTTVSIKFENFFSRRPLPIALNR